MSTDFIELIPKKHTVALQLNRSTSNELIFRHGHIAITNYKLGDNRGFEKSLSVWDPIYYKWNLIGGHYVEALREFRVNRGYDLAKLSAFFPNHTPRVDNNAYPADKEDIKLLAAPRDDFQKVALTFMACQGEYSRNLSFTQQLIDADTGDGKAQPDDTLVPTPDGWRRLDQLNLGDYVFNLHGEPVKVLSIYPQHGMQETYELKFKDGRTTRCNPEHLWRIINLDGIVEVIPLSDMLKNRNRIYSVERPRMVRYNYQKPPADPYSIGVMIRNSYATIQDNDMCIPLIYRRNSVDVRQSVLRGLFNINDIIPPYFSYTTASVKLKDDIVELVRSLGYLAYVNAVNDQYKIDVINDINDTLDIVDIKKVESTHQRCIYIDDPLHVYITENFIPTHNTYCGVATSAFLSAKTIIIVPIAKLLEQWKASFLTFTTVKDDEIMIVQGSKSCKKIRDGLCKDKKVFLFMVNTLMAYHKKYGDLETIELLRATNAYTKIVDEVHRDMKTMATIEALSNFRMNYYMSASPGRSDQKEDWIFRTLYKNIPRFGSDFKTQDEKHINIIIKKYKFYPSSEQIRKMYRPTVGLNSNSYEKVLLESPPMQNHEFTDSVASMLVWTKKLLKDGNKVLVLCNTVDGTKKMKEMAEKVYPGKSATYYSTGMSKKEKEAALEQTVIAATQTSVGTGADIPGIQFVLNITTYSSKISSTQLPGRARKLKDGTPVIYVEFVNIGYNATYRQFEKRRPFLKARAKGSKLMIVD